MLPDIENGKLQFSRKHALLLEQFEKYGSGSHDDLLDATEISVSVSKNVRREIQNKPSWM
jgi:hypothetical protein